MWDFGSIAVVDAWIFGVLALFLIAVTWSLPIVYLRTGWIDRKLELLSTLDTTAKREYLSQFPPPGIHVRDWTNDAAIEQAFDRYYDRRFGRQLFVGPLVTFAVVSAAAIAWVAYSVQQSVPLLPETGASDTRAAEGGSPADRVPPDGAVTTRKTRPPNLAVFAIAGGLMWVLSDLVRRVGSRQLAPINLNWMTFRLIIAVPVAQAVCMLATDDEASRPAIALLMGTFPTQTLLTFGRRAALRVLQPQHAADELRESELQLLPEIDQRKAEIFADDGITTIVQLAHCDFVGVAIRTNVDIAFVLDCVNRALLVIRFPHQRETLRTLPLQGAREVISLVRRLESGSEAEKTAAKRIVDESAAQLEIDPVLLMEVLHQIAGDRYAAIVHHIWVSREHAE